VTKLVEGKFPDYNRVIPKNHKTIITLGRQPPCWPALQRAAILTNEKFKGVRMCVRAGPAQASRRATPSRKRPRKSSRSTTGRQLDIGFNVGYLMDVLNNMSQDMVTCAARRQQLAR
jgi:DNA polymerase-3 subunit beta